MRKIISAGVGLLALAGTTHPMMAADLKAPAYKAPVDLWSWTGVYVGGNGGYSWGRSGTDVSVTNSVTNAVLYTTNSTFDLRGGVAGVQIGVNWQWGMWVGGFEADLQATGQRGGAGFTCPAGVCTTSTAVPAASRIASGSLSEKLAWFGTLRARLGVTITPTIVAYGTAGIAYGETYLDSTLSGVGPAGPVAGGFASTDSTTKTGWTAGFGVEARLWDNWTGRFEYLYVDLNRFSAAGALPGNAPPIIVTYSSRLTDSIVRVGLNYKIENGPLVAKY
jgi:outer membrane immunogenic protein